MKDLQIIEETVAEGLATVTPDKLVKISERMVEIDRASQTLGRKNTQTTNQLMTLTMMTDSPYRRLRQCITQIESKKTSIRSSYYSAKKKMIEIGEWEKEGTELSLLEAEEARMELYENKKYVDGALKELAVFQEAYEEIRKNNNITVLWDEAYAEMDEIRHHVRQAFRQAHRDMILTGSISQGNAEYLEQYGIHLQTARNFIATYIAECERIMKEDGQMPNIDHLYEFFDNCVEIFGEEYIKVMNHIGITDLVRSEWLFKGNMNKDV